MKASLLDVAKSIYLFYGLSFFVRFNAITTLVYDHHLSLLDTFSKIHAFRLL